MLKSPILASLHLWDRWVLNIFSACAGIVHSAVGWNGAFIVSPPYLTSFSLGCATSTSQTTSSLISWNSRTQKHKNHIPVWHRGGPFPEVFGVFLGSMEVDGEVGNIIIAGAEQGMVRGWWWIYYTRGLENGATLGCQEDSEQHTGPMILWKCRHVTLVSPALCIATAALLSPTPN